MDRGRVYQKGKHTQHYTISKCLESCTDTFYRYLQEPKSKFSLGWSGKNSCRSRVLASCLKRWVGFWLLAIKWQNPAGGKAWTRKWRLESKGHVYLMARSLIWLEWGAHKRVTSKEGRKSGPKSKGLIFELFGRWEPQKVSEQGTGWSRAPIFISESSSFCERCREKDGSVFIQKKCSLFEGWHSVSQIHLALT